MIGRIAYHGIRAAARASSQPQRQGPPKEWGPAGKIAAVAVLAAIIGGMHWWVQALYVLGAGVLMTVLIMGLAMGGQQAKREAARQRQRDALDHAMRDLNRKP